MTEDELKRIENEFIPLIYGETGANDVRALIAEVRRLRALVPPSQAEQIMRQMNN